MQNMHKPNAFMTLVASVENKNREMPLIFSEEMPPATNSCAKLITIAVQKSRPTEY